MSSPLDRPLKFEIKLPSSHPELLEGLDTLLRLGLISDAQVKQIAFEFLVCQMVSQPETKPESQVAFTTTEPVKAAAVPQKPVKPNLIATMLQSLGAELSVRWLLFLGVFLVVVSSGVLAATQWERFPASGQYGVLLAYTLSFWGLSFWAGKQPNLRLTAQTLLIVTLLLVPVNFWAMDSFKLWQNPVDWLVIAIAFPILTTITILLCKNRLFIANSPIGKLPLVNILALSYLHWGWKLPGFPLIAVYLAMIGTTIITVYHNRNRSANSLQEEDKRVGLGITLPALIVVYALAVLLVRAIFVVRVDITQLGLAIGICGWLVAWLAQRGGGEGGLLGDKGTRGLLGDKGTILSPHPPISPSPHLPISPSPHPLVPLSPHLPLSPSPTPQLPWEILGGILLFLGWLVTVVSSPLQAIAVSGLSLWFFNRRLQQHAFKVDLAAIFVIGLQTVWLAWRLIPAELQQSAIEEATKLTNSQNEPWALLSVALFPYLIFMVALTNRIYRTQKRELATFGDNLTLLFGIFLTTIALVNPILRSLNLLFSTITLAAVTHQETRRQGDRGTGGQGGQGGQGEELPITHYPLPIPHSPLPTSLIYLTHITGVLTLCSTIDWLLPNLQTQVWASILLALMVAEWLQSVGAGIWRRSAWHIGFGLAVISYLLLWKNASAFWTSGIINSDNWGLIWLITPITLTVIASRTSAPRRITSSLLSVLTLLAAQLLILPLPGTRLIGLGVGTAGMFANTRYLRNNQSAGTTVGFGLSFLAVLLWDGVFNLPHLSLDGWFVVGAIAIFSLWFASKALSRGEELAAIYATVIDKWAIALCSFELLSLTLHSLLLYQNFAIPGFLYLISTALTLAAIVYRSWQQPTNLAFYGIGWCLELLIAQVFGFGKGDIIKIAIANIALGLITQLFGEWWRRRHQLSKMPSSFHILPLIYGAFSVLLRLNTFTEWTGLYSLGVALIVIGVGRRHQDFKPLLYLGIAGISISAYELLFYQMSQASGGAWGDGLIAMSALGASIMYAYRILSPWLINYLPLTPEELKGIAHIHWAWSSCLLMVAITAPIAVNRLVGLATGAFLIRYAIFQGRRSPTSPTLRLGGITTEEIWVYLGLLEFAGMRIYWRETAVGQLLTGVLVPWNGAIACLVAYILYILPWESWGWSKKPWQLAAYIIPLIIFWETRLQVYPITIAIAAAYYIFLAKIRENIRFTYISVALIDWALFRWFANLHLTDTLWYITLIGLSLLYIAQVDVSLILPDYKTSRHYLRLLGSSIICGWAILFHQETAVIPGIFSLIAIFAGLALRVRAFLYVGTATFFITSIYQLIIFSLRYPFLKWVIGLLVGILLISIAANFERRRAQINSLLRNTTGGFQEWE
ncbi:hypothetical protein NIES4075_48740 [Tolypothrix sp. NIES-4075]|uniref:DUF2157 domain-containing protein n=1 Tax=Tolypothrix sp. NIES-4075 TaxID=2005459 RepID=UPI000B5CCD03|nr:DUF2157 domain-containing protein [Tolypothrix sp. NIES-4075]GAX43859.1 hypothetical protein NIES4075_48740 [Tolypothrix sp. NIES-4075]